MWHALTVQPHRAESGHPLIRVFRDDGGPAAGVEVLRGAVSLGHTDDGGVLALSETLGDATELTLRSDAGQQAVELAPVRAVAKRENQWLLVPDQPVYEPGDRLRYRLVARRRGLPLEIEGAVELVLAGGRVAAGDRFATDRFGVAAGSLPIPECVADQRAGLQLVSGEVQLVRAIEIRRHRRPPLRAELELPSMLQPPGSAPPPGPMPVIVRWAMGEPLDAGELRVAIRGGEARWQRRLAVTRGQALLDVPAEEWQALLAGAFARRTPLVVELETRDPLGRSSLQLHRIPLGGVRGRLELFDDRVAPGARVIGRALVQAADGRAATAQPLRLRTEWGAELTGLTAGDGSWVFEIEAPTDVGEHRLDLLVDDQPLRSAQLHVGDHGPLMASAAVGQPGEPLALRGHWAGGVEGAVRLGYAVCDPTGELLASGPLTLDAAGDFCVEVLPTSGGIYGALCYAIVFPGSDGGLPTLFETRTRLVRQPRPAPRFDVEPLPAEVLPGEQLTVRAELTVDDVGADRWLLAGWMVSGGLASSRPLEQQLGHPGLLDVRWPRLRWAGRRRRVSLTSSRIEVNRARGRELRASDGVPWWVPRALAEGPRIEVPLEVPRRPGRHQLRLTAAASDGRQVEYRHLLHVRRQTRLEAELPELLTQADEVALPVWVAHHGEGSLEGRVSLELGGGLRLVGERERPVVLACGASARDRWVVVAERAGPASLTWRLHDGGGAVIDERHHTLEVRPAGTVWRERRALVPGAPLTIGEGAGAVVRVGAPSLVEWMPLVALRDAVAPGAARPGIEALAARVEACARLLGSLDDVGGAMQRMSLGTRTVGEALRAGVAELLGSRGELGWSDLGPGDDPMVSAQAVIALTAARRVGVPVPEDALRRSIIGLFRTRGRWGEGGAGLALQAEVLAALYDAEEVGVRRAEEAADDLEGQLVRRLVEEAPGDPLLFARAVQPLRQHGELVALAAQLVTVAFSAPASEEAAEAGAVDLPVVEGSPIEGLAAAVGVLCRSSLPVPPALADALRTAAVRLEPARRPRAALSLTRLLTGVPLARALFDAPLPPRIAVTVDGEERLAVETDFARTGGTPEGLALALGRIALAPLPAPSAEVALEAEGAVLAELVVTRESAEVGPLPDRQVLTDRVSIGQAVWVDIVLPEDTGDGRTRGVVLHEPLPANAQIDIRSLDELVGRGVITRWRLAPGELRFDFDRVPPRLSYLLVAARHGSCRQPGPRLWRVSSGTVLQGRPTKLSVDLPPSP